MDEIVKAFKESSERATVSYPSRSEMMAYCFGFMDALDALHREDLWEKVDRFIITHYLTHGRWVEDKDE